MVGGKGEGLLSIMKADTDEVWVKGQVHVVFWQKILLSGYVNVQGKSKEVAENANNKVKKSIRSVGREMAEWFS